MLNFGDPFTILLGKRLADRKGISIGKALLAASLPVAGAAGKVLVADRLTERMAVGQAVRVQAPRPVVLGAAQPIAMGPALGAFAPGVLSLPPGVFVQPKPAATAPSGYIQKIENATTVDLSKDPVQIEGSAGIKIDFVSPRDAKSYSWDFGDDKITKSSAKNPVAKKYDNKGEFEVILTIVDAAGKETEHKAAKVKIA